MSNENPPQEFHAYHQTYSIFFACPKKNETKRARKDLFFTYVAPKMLWIL